ncbi:hypothetical protein SB775_08090 [Peribacillus sp. SIMBA_075]|uniref:hypothetical protein n=1 Tax=Peribacillus sp. SIMBA_075 TaxID=3085813 RepID=UPI0039782483
MLSKHDSIQRDQLEMITLDQLVLPNHLVRKMEAAIDFTFIYDLVVQVIMTAPPLINSFYAYFSEFQQL